MQFHYSQLGRSGKICRLEGFSCHAIFPVFAFPVQSGHLATALGNDNHGREQLQSSERARRATKHRERTILSLRRRRASRNQSPPAHPTQIEILTGSYAAAREE